MPDITDQEIENAAKELSSNLPDWSKNLMKSDILHHKATKFLIDMTAAMSIGYLIGYKHAKAEILQKI